MLYGKARAWQRRTCIVAILAHPTIRAAVQQCFVHVDLRGSAAFFGSAPSAFALYCQRSS
jgi:hypothetical protein